MGLNEGQTDWRKKGQPGGTVNPNKRKVTQDSIDGLGLDKLKFDENGKATIGFTFDKEPTK